MIDFTASSKNYLTVVMKDGKQLFVLPPKKSTFGKMIALQSAADMQVDDLYTLAAEVLSNNRQKRRYTEKDLENMDIIEIRQLFTAYVQFIMEEKQAPN